MTGLTIERCRDPVVIESLLAEDYYDLPVSQFSKRLLSAAGRWLALNDAVHFVTAVTSDKVAGYAFAHTLGPRLWWHFGFSSFTVFVELSRVYLKTRLVAKKASKEIGAKHPIVNQKPDSITTSQIESSHKPFAWTPPDNATAYVEMLYVRPDFRGQHVAKQLLRSAVGQMRGANVCRAEAHIDANNYASLKAFIGAGWQVQRTCDGDYFAYFQTS